MLLTQGPRSAGTSLTGIVDPRSDILVGEFGALLAARLMLLAGLAAVAGRL